MSQQQKQQEHKGECHHNHGQSHDYDFRQEWQRNTEAFMHLTQMQMRRMQELAQLNTEVVQRNMQRSLEASRELMACRSPQHVQQAGQNIWQDMSKNFSQYMQDLFDISARSSAEMFKVCSGRMCESGK